MRNKALIVSTISIVVIRIFASPIITAVVIKTGIKSLWYISYSLTFISLLLITLCVIQVMKYIPKEATYRVGNEIVKRNIYKNLILPLFLILLAVFLSYTLRILMGLPYHGKPAHLTPIYLDILPLFLSVLVIGIIYGKRGWLMGIFVGCVMSSLLIGDSYILYSISHHMTIFEFMGFLLRSHISYSIMIGRYLILSTLGGFLGGWIRYQFDLMMLSKVSLVPKRKPVRILSLAILAVVILCLIGGSFIYSQFATSKMKELPFKQWGKTFKGRCMSFQPTKDGGFIFVGKVDQPKMGYSYLMKIDNQGDTLWNRKYDGVLLRMAQETADCNYIVTGSKRVGDNEDDVLLMKTDSVGNIIWEKSYGGNHEDYGVSVIETSEGDFVIAGFSDLNVAILIKADEEGNVIWQRAYWSDNSLGYYLYFGYSILETSDNGYIISASTGDRVQLLKVNKDGESEWTSMFVCESLNGNASSVISTYDDCYAITGYLFRENMTCDICLVKVDKNGERIWTRAYGDEGIDFGYDIKQTPDSGYVIIATTTHIHSYPKYIPQFVRELRLKYSLVEDILYHMKTGIRTKIYILKVDGEGNELWRQEFFGRGSMDPDEDWLHENHSYFFIQNTMDGGYIVAGKSSLRGFRDIDFYIHKLK